MMRTLILSLFAICLFMSPVNAASIGSQASSSTAEFVSEAPTQQTVQKRAKVRKGKRALASKQETMPGTRWFYASIGMSLVSIIFSSGGMILPAATCLAFAIIFFAVGLGIFLRARKKEARSKSS